jgi:hypothetical protein
MTLVATVLGLVVLSKSKEWTLAMLKNHVPLTPLIFFAATYHPASSRPRGLSDQHSITLSSNWASRFFRRVNLP